MKKISKVLTGIALVLWQLPQCLIGLLMLPFLGKLTFLEYRNYCWGFMGEKMSGAISLGCFAFFSKYSSQRDTTIAHEMDGHTKDSKIFGPFYLFIIGIPSILNAWIGFTKCYYSFFTERLANKHAGLGVDSKCRLYFIDKTDYNKKR